MVQIIIRGHDLPGSQCGGGVEARQNVHVALQVGRDPVGPISADATAAEWATDLQVVDTAIGRDFRGPAVHGKRGERFLYLTWGEIDDTGFTMFRRAKLMLEDIPPTVATSDHLVASVHLTDDRGMPRCARVRPPAIRWSRA